MPRDIDAKQRATDLAERVNVVRERLYWTQLRSLLLKLITDERRRRRVEK